MRRPQIVTWSGAPFSSFCSTPVAIALQRRLALKHAVRVLEFNDFQIRSRGHGGQVLRGDEHELAVLVFPALLDELVERHGAAHHVHEHVELVHDPERALEALPERHQQAQRRVRPLPARQELHVLDLRLRVPVVFLHRDVEFFGLVVERDCPALAFLVERFVELGVGYSADGLPKPLPLGKADAQVALQQRFVLLDELHARHLLLVQPFRTQRALHRLVHVALALRELLQQTLFVLAELADLGLEVVLVFPLGHLHGHGGVSSEVLRRVLAGRLRGVLEGPQSLRAHFLDLRNKVLHLFHLLGGLLHGPLPGLPLAQQTRQLVLHLFLLLLELPGRRLKVVLLLHLGLDFGLPLPAVSVGVRLPLLALLRLLLHAAQLLLPLARVHRRLLRLQLRELRLQPRNGLLQLRPLHVVELVEAFFEAVELAHRLLSNGLGVPLLRSLAVQVLLDVRQVRLHLHELVLHVHPKRRAAHRLAPGDVKLVAVLLLGHAPAGVEDAAHALEGPQAAALAAEASVLALFRALEQHGLLHGA
mmetsp:Transcript_34103/g.69726  ORF Transcript_34103/g.69726 Transcript_34103/m.69726 type:complete len:533 (+) Transcript_34103:161-1759(+)